MKPGTGLSWLACLPLSLWLSIAAAAPFVADRPLVVRYFQTDSRYAYRIELLQLALQHTVATDGAFSLQPLSEEVSPERGLRLLAGGKLDVAFLPTNNERESHYRAIRIPILRGLLGYRVLLVNAKSLPKFAGIHSLQQLRQMQAGFGSQWADLAILQENGLPVTAVATYDGLFGMLAAERFDYFPRGINEAWNELAERREEYPNLRVEPHIALYYPYAVYFFVRRDNAALAQRIERGLQLALADDSFRQLFLRYNQHDIEQADLNHRDLFVLSNHKLPPDTPNIDTSWWLPQQKLSEAQPASMSP